MEVTGSRWDATDNFMNSSQTYYRVGKKLRRQIADAISQGALRVMREKLPFTDSTKRGGPDDWTEEEKFQFDLVGEVESAATEEVEKVLLKKLKQVPSGRVGVEK